MLKADKPKAEPSGIRMGATEQPKKNAAPGEPDNWGVNEILPEYEAKSPVLNHADNLCEGLGCYEILLCGTDIDHDGFETGFNQDRNLR